ncbi:MAG: fumarate reductase/succinate dehydrogenase flavoprotein subunit, partial [Chloroflexi bacterium]|nr:fumarate reductase/succinate dehydrogenase flavoprotein subunit [Chloroflexota bacterium]
DDGQVEVERKLLHRPFESKGRENPFLFHEELQKIMADHAGIARTEDGLKEGLEKLLALKERTSQLHVEGSFMFNPGWHTARDDLFMLTICEALLRCAIERRESRGAHWRLDYPDQDPEQSKINLITRQVNGEMVVEARPIPPLPAELTALLKES